MILICHALIQVSFCWVGKSFKDDDASKPWRTSTLTRKPHTVCWVLTQTKTIDRHPVNQHPPAHHPLDDAPLITRLWMNLNSLISVYIWFHLGNQFYEKQVSYIGTQVGRKIGNYQVSRQMVYTQINGSFYYLPTNNPVCGVVSRQLVNKKH